MKPVPIANYLDHIGTTAGERTAPRREASPFRPRSLQSLQSLDPRSPPVFERTLKPVGAAKSEAAERPRPLFERRAAPLEAPGREQLLARETAKAEEMALKIEEARAQGLEEGRALGRAEAEDQLAAERAEMQERAVMERLEFQLNEYAQLETTLRAGFAEVEANVGAAVARILASFLVKEVARYAAVELVKAINGLGGGRRAGSHHDPRPGAAVELCCASGSPIFRPRSSSSRTAASRRRSSAKPLGSRPSSSRGRTCWPRSTDPMSEHPNEIVIVRRRGGGHAEASHGGAWKVAFADFMTALMAFFLVLWIISATDKNTKTLIARYFNPVKVEEPAKAQKGIHGAPEQDTDAPGTDSGAPNGQKSHSNQGDAAHGDGAGIARGSAGRSEAEAQGQARAPIAAARPVPAPADHVGSGAVQRPARQPRQDRGRAAARATRRSRRIAEGIRRCRLERRGCAA